VGDPPVAVAWLINTPAARGAHLSSGSGVLPGGRTASVVVWPGANVVAEIDGLGSVEAASREEHQWAALCGNGSRDRD
jgi:2-keto-4-pentenoate hydratase